MTNNKQKRTAMELADSLVREIRYYCEENGIDTALGFELAKSIRRENDLVTIYVDLGEDGYADWISDIITSHFEEEEKEKEEGGEMLVQNWLEDMIMSQHEAFAHTLTEAMQKDNIIEQDMIKKNYKEWLDALKIICVSLRIDYSTLVERIGLPDEI